MAVLTTAAATKQGIQDFITAAAARRTTCKEQLPPLTTPSKTPPLMANISEEFKTNGLANTNQGKKLAKMIIMITGTPAGGQKENECLWSKNLISIYFCLLIPFVFFVFAVSPFF